MSAFCEESLKSLLFPSHLDFRRNPRISQNRGQSLRVPVYVILAIVSEN